MNKISGYDMRDTIDMAREAGIGLEYEDHYQVINLAELEAFEALVRADEREAIMDNWWMCVQSDLENGVKSLNERAAEKWKQEYPAISGFAATIEAAHNIKENI